MWIYIKKIKDGYNIDINGTATEDGTYFRKTEEEVIVFIMEVMDLKMEYLERYLVEQLRLEKDEKKERVPSDA